MGRTADVLTQTAQVATTLDAQMIDELPVNRSIRETTLLSPGVNDAGPNNQIVIGGAQSFDSLFLVNGVVVNEKACGAPRRRPETAVASAPIVTVIVDACGKRPTRGVTTRIWDVDQR